MGAGLWPVFNPSQASVHPDFDGALLLECFEDLDALADRLGVAAMSSFADNRDVPDDFDGDPDELREVLGPWDDWFSISEGVAVFTMLADALDDSEHAQAFERPSEVQAELRDLAACLGEVDSGTTRFRLEVLF